MSLFSYHVTRSATLRPAVSNEPVIFRWAYPVGAKGLFFHALVYWGERRARQTESGVLRFAISGSWQHRHIRTGTGIQLLSDSPATYSRREQYDGKSITAGRFQGEFSLPHCTFDQTCHQTSFRLQAQLWFSVQQRIIPLGYGNAADRCIRVNVC